MQEEDKATEDNAIKANLLQDNIDFIVDEKLSFQVNRDGDIEKFDLKGTVYI